MLDGEDEPSSSLGNPKSEPRNPNGVAQFRSGMPPRELLSDFGFEILDSVDHRSIAAPVWVQSARARASATSATWPGWSSLGWPTEPRNFWTTSLVDMPVAFATRAALARVMVVSTYPGQIAFTVMP